MKTSQMLLSASLKPDANHGILQLISAKLKAWFESWAFVEVMVFNHLKFRKTLVFYEIFIVAVTCQPYLNRLIMKKQRNDTMYCDSHHYIEALY